jgi:long-subunit acyl-CoA synthetase (AMP-forming)
MLSHDNLVWTAQVVASTVGVRAGDVILSYLPLSHVAEQLLTLHTSMAVGAECAFAESMEAVPQNLREVRPSFFFGVPRVWEKMQAAMQAAGAQASPLRRRLVAWAKRQGLAGIRRAARRAPAVAPRPGPAPRVRQGARAPGLTAVCAVSAAPIGVPTRALPVPRHPVLESTG